MIEIEHTAVKILAKMDTPTSMAYTEGENYRTSQKSTSKPLLMQDDLYEDELDDSENSEK